MRAMLAMVLIGLAVPAGGVPLASDKSRFAACSVQARSNPSRGIAAAQAWRIEGGGVPARHCLALAQFEAGDYPASLASFEAAAKMAASAPDGAEEARALWVAAATAALIANRPEPALGFLDQALAGKPDAGLLLMRAEALVDLGREADAMPAIEQALALDAAVENGWLLKATLARRLGRLEAAEAAILEAARRLPADSPEQADVQLEAGNIAFASGKTELARAAWTAVASGEPEQPATKAAAAALARLPDSGTTN